MYPEIETPAVLVDLDVAEANIQRYQAYCDAHGLKLRPHIKTHKLPSLGKRQVAAGAVGITCQKVTEAEAMIAEGGIDDVLITYNILGEEKLGRLRALAGRVRLAVVADNATVVDGLSAAFADAASPLRVLVECNTGADRCGVPSPEAARDLALRIDAAPGLNFAGLMTYPAPGGTADAQGWLSEAKAACEAAGLRVETVSSGGSPDMWRAHEAPVVTEYRVGTCAYNDRSLVARGVCGWEDCALTVLATVVSVPDPRRAVIDAGSKVLTSDLLGLDGHGHVLGRDDIRIDQLSEEHGRLVSDGPIGLEVGARVRIVPNHACVVANMLDQVATLRASAFDGYLPVTARGRVR
jgi:D-serine deaminase-like pyridoxal phosphate-dependent protein